MELTLRKADSDVKGQSSSWLVLYIPNSQSPTTFSHQTAILKVPNAHF